MSRRARIAVWILSPIAILAIIISGGFAWLASGSGRTWLARTIEAAASGPGMTVSVTPIEGSLPFNPRIPELRVADREGTWLVARDVVLDVSPGALLGGRVHVHELSAAEIAVERPPVAEEPSPPTPDEGLPTRLPELEAPSLPVAVTLERLAVDRVVLGPALAGAPMTWRLAASGTLERGAAALTLDLDRVDDSGTVKIRAGLASDPGQLDADIVADEPGGRLLAGLMGRADPLPLHVELHGSGPLAAWRGRFDARAGTAQLGMDIAIDQPDERWRAKVAATGQPGDLVAPDLANLIGPQPTLEATVSPVAPRGIELLDLRLAAAGVRLGGKGVLAPERLDLALSAEVADLAPFGTGLGGRVNAEMRIGGTEKRPTIEGTVTAADLRAAEATVGRLEATLKAAALDDLDAADPRVSAALDLRAERLTAPGLRGETGSAEASVALETDTALQSARLSRLTARLPGLTLDAEGSKDQRALAAKLRLAIDDLAKVAALVLEPSPGGLAPRGTLTVDGEVSGPPDDADITLKAEGQTLATGIPQADALLRGGLHLDAKGHWNGDTLAIGDLTLALAEAKAGLKGSVSPASEKMAIDFEATLARLGIVDAGIRGAARLKGSLGGTFGAPSLRATLDGTDIASGGVRIDRLSADVNASDLVKPDARVEAKATAGKLDASLRLAVQREREGLRVRDLLLQGAGARVAGDLLLDPKNRVTGRLRGHIPDLGPWSALAGQPLTGSIELDAKADARRGQAVDIDLTALNLALGDDPAALRVGRARLTAKLDNLPDQPGGTADLTVQRLAAGQASFTSLRLGVRPASGGRLGFTLAADGTIPSPLTLEAAGTITPQEPKRAFALTRLNGSLAGERIALRRALSVEQAGDGWRAAPFALAIGQGTLRGSGRYDPARIDAELAVQRLALAFLARLGGMQDPLAGTLDLDVDLAGPLQQPTGKAVLSLANAGFADAGKQPADRISARVEANLVPGATRLQATASTGEATRLDATGTLPVSLDLTGSGVAVDRQRPLDLRAQGGADLGKLADVLPLGEDRLSGMLRLDLTVGGTIARPLPRGTVSLADGRYVNQISGLILEKLALDVGLDGERIAIRRLEATDGERGRLAGTGWVDLAHEPRPSYDIAIAFNDFHIARRDDASVFANADLHVVDRTTKAVARGTITVTNAELRIPERLPPSVVVLDVVEVDSRKAQRPEPPRRSVAKSAGEALALDIEVSLPRQTYVRGRGLDSEWQGKLHVGGTSAGPLIDGNLSVVRGTLALLNRDFKLSRGSITFNGTPEINPALDLLAETNTNGITAQVLIGGTPKAPKLTLTADPPLPQDEVLARVLFDRDLGSITPIQGLQLAQAANTLAGGGGSFDVLDKLRSATGLSRLSVNSPTDPTAGLGGTTVSGGKYIADGVYVGVDQGTTGASTKAKVEIEVTPHITVDSTMGSTGQGVGLNYKFDY